MSHKMVIVTGQAGTLKQAAQYLKNRQWDVYSTDNLKDAISEAVKRKADFVLIAADHPNRRVKNLPKLLNQACPSARLIGYIDSNSRTAVSALTEFHFDYVVYPPVSGPSVERVVLKILKEEREVEASKAARDNVGPSVTSAKDEVFVAKGEKMKPGYFATQQGLRGNFDSATQAGVAGSLNQTSQANSQKNSEQTRRRMMQALGSAKAVEQGPRQGKFSYAGGQLLNPNFNSVPPETASNNPRRAWYEPALDQGAAADPFHADWSGLDDDGVPSPSNESGRESASEHVRPQKKLQLGELGDKELAAAPQFDPPSSSGRSEALAEKSAPTAAAILARSPLGVSIEPSLPTDADLEKAPLKNKKTIVFKQDPRKLPEQDSLLAQLTQRALNESVNFTGDDEFENLGISQQFACLVVKSPRFSGYLIAGLGRNRAVDLRLMARIRIKLFEILREQGENISDSEPMQLELEEVSLEDWAFNQGRFLKKAIHENQEIAIAFFQNAEVAPELEPSEIEYMLKMKIERLELESDLDFDLYIFLPANNRLLLYTPNGRRVEREQRSRLLDKGVTYLHLRKESHALVQRYFARARLNESILEFRSKTLFTEI